MAPRLRRWQSLTGRGDQQAAVTEFILPVVVEAAAEAIAGDQAFVAESVASYRARRGIIVELLTGIEGLTAVRPEG